MRYRGETAPTRVVPIRFGVNGVGTAGQTPLSNLKWLDPLCRTDLSADGSHQIPPNQLKPWFSQKPPG
jgi:hypothetical protein